MARGAAPQPSQKWKECPQMGKSVLRHVESLSAGRIRDRCHSLADSRAWPVSCRLQKAGTAIALVARCPRPIAGRLSTSQKLGEFRVGKVRRFRSHRMGVQGPIHKRCQEAGSRTWHERSCPRQDPRQATLAKPPPSTVGMLSEIEEARSAGKQDEH